MASTQKKPEKTKQTAAGKKSGGAKSQTKRPSQGKGKAASPASRQASTTALARSRQPSPPRVTGWQRATRVPASRAIRSTSSISQS